MDPRRVELYLRHIHEGGAKIAEFLKAHPDIDPDFIEDMTDKEEAELQQYSSDLAITQQIERDELTLSNKSHLAQQAYNATHSRQSRPFYIRLSDPQNTQSLTLCEEE
jgi:hypothetical protein